MIHREVDRSLCIRCGMCAKACPCEAISLDEEGVHFNCPSDCSFSIVCYGGLEFFYPCEEACPTGALSIAYEIAHQTS